MLRILDTRCSHPCVCYHLAVDSDLGGVLPSNCGSDKVRSVAEGPDQVKSTCNHKKNQICVGVNSVLHLL